ncbi:MAG TPA: helix-turn-helix transcriptional regulator [Verrucomicrobiae bacterium]|nr:helix-turn-helix transcriptional regulator [Verrucomicrobiae bacterium]
MSTVADKLRTAREAQNLTIHQVAEITKMRTDHIRALEEGNFDVFSAPVYIRGFVRTYSTLLKLDVPQTMAALDVELGKTEKHSEPPPLTEQKKGSLDFVMLQLSRIDPRKGAIAAGVLLVIIVVVLILSSTQRRRQSQPTQGSSPALYQPRQPGGGETLPVPAPPARR